MLQSKGDGRPCWTALCGWTFALIVSVAIMDMRSSLMGLLKIGLPILLAVLPLGAKAAETIPEVLIIHSYHSGLSWTDSIMNGIRDGFAQGRIDVQMGAEYLDARRSVDVQQARRIRELVISKFKRDTPDLLIVSDNAAFDFVLEQRERSFAGVPIVFCGVNNFDPAILSRHRGITGVVEDVSVLDTVDLARRLHPETDRIIVIGRTRVAADKANRDSFAAALTRRPDIPVTFWDDLPVSELQTRLEGLERGTIVFLNGLITDEMGRELMYGESTQWVSRHSPVPIYSLWDVYLGYGIVGGKLVSGYRQGRMAARLALRILGGQIADGMPVVTALEANQYMFDHRQLRRFDIPASKLPRRAVIINRPDSLFERYKRYVWTTLLVVSLLSVMALFFGLTIIRRRKVEEALKQANIVVENSPAVLFRWGTGEGWPVSFVSSNVKQFGYTPEELLSGEVLFASMVHPEDLDRVASEVRDYTDRRISTFRQEYRIVAKGGDVLWVDDCTLVLRDREGRVTGYQGILIDVSERKRAQEEQSALREQLLHSQKMETVGLLAGGVAHDFNNLLTPILGYIDLLAIGLPEGHPNLRKLKHIRQSAEKARDLTQRLLAFSRKQVLDLKVVRLDDVVRQFEEVLRRTIREDIRITVRIEPSVSPIWADRGQIEQTLLNLSINAQEAMPEGGSLAIEVGDIDLDETYASHHVEITPGRYVLLSVSDTGRGMDEKTLEHIFDPFFTTKELGKGMGLGLSTAYGIVKQHGGNISVYSEAGRGSTFKIFFPRVVEGKSPYREPSAVKDEVPRGEEVVLLVEDDETVRRTTADMLTSIGYRVLAAEDVDHGVRTVKEHPGPVHLLLTDVIMPNMSGMELYELIKPQRPEIKVLFMSGYAGNVIAHHGILEEGGNFIQKPFSLRALSQKVRLILDS